ncbi:MAG: glutathione peroxidase [Pseudomonadota bacterium]
MHRRQFLITSSLFAAVAGGARAASGFTFPSIDGGDLALDDWRGRPVLVANTASLCGFTPQYDSLQALYDRYRDRGLIVLAVPSDDFSQELDTAADVKEFCEINFDLDLPMTDITRVRGRDAHPFYRWLDEAHGVRPRWNFNKVLIDPEGGFAGFWGSRTDPQSREITDLIDRFLQV